VEVSRVEIQRTKHAVEIWTANMKSNESPSFESQFGGPGSNICPWRELAKFFFGQSNHTLVAILTMLTVRYGMKPGSEDHARLLGERDKIIEEFSVMLKDDNSVFLYPTFPFVAP
jgi:hypothetical protein